MEDKLKLFLDSKMEEGLKLLSKSEIEKQKGNYSESNKLYTQWSTIKLFIEEINKLHKLQTQWILIK